MWYSRNNSPQSFTDSSPKHRTFWRKKHTNNCNSLSDFWLLQAITLLQISVIPDSLLLSDSPQSYSLAFQGLVLQPGLNSHYRRQVHLRRLSVELLILKASAKAKYTFSDNLSMHALILLAPYNVPVTCRAVFSFHVSSPSSSATSAISKLLASRLSR